MQYIKPLFRFGLRSIPLLFLIASATGSAKSAMTQESPLPGKEKAKTPTYEEIKNAGQDSKSASSGSQNARYAVLGDSTFILQDLFRFHSPYHGRNSLRSRSETELTNTYTLYVGARLTQGLEVYVNPELALGNGIGEGNGLAAGVNGDLIGQPSLRQEPYLARYFVRWRIPLQQSGSKPVREVRVGRAPNFNEGNVPARRIVITVGKFAVSDIFDTNLFANDPRSQFINDAFGNNLAYDFAQDLRGYNVGAAVSWINADFTVRLGSFAMPTEAGGPDLAFNLSGSHGDQFEVEAHPHLLSRPHPASSVRLLAWRNVAGMGSFARALAVAKPGEPPDVIATRQSHAVKYGFGLNFDQALSEEGATGVFGRVGWNDGRAETYNYAEADRFVSAGGQLSGKHWRRNEDILGIATAQSDLSAVHRAYLAAGGLGTGVGDGKLNYGSERILEVYYSCHLTRPASLTLDYQCIANPGYNRNRGPVSLVALRLHMMY